MLHAPAGLFSPVNLWKSFLLWGPIVVRVALGGVFLVAAMSKAVDPRSAINSSAAALGIERYDAWLVVLGVAIAEVVLGSALLCGLLPRLMMAIAAVVLAAFTVFLVRLALHGATLRCGCLLPMAEMPARVELWVGVARNVAFGGAALWACRRSARCSTEV